MSMKEQGIFSKIALILCFVFLLLMVAQGIVFSSMTIHELIHSGLVSEEGLGGSGICVGQFTMTLNGETFEADGLAFGLRGSEEEAMAGTFVSFVALAILSLGAFYYIVLKAGFFRRDLK